MYPILKNNVSYGSFTLDGASHYVIGDPDDNNFVEISQNLYKTLISGKNPTDCNKYDQYSLNLLEQYGMLQTTRFVKNEGFTNQLILLIFRNSRQIRNICKPINAILPYISCIVFILGIIFGQNSIYRNDFHFGIYIFLTYSSIFFHECGHCVAAAAYNYEIRDCGLLLLGILPIGAYITKIEKERPKRNEELQVDLAGIETNLLIAGICMIIAHLFHSFTFYSIAKINILLSCINVLPSTIIDLDGSQAFQTVLGVEDIGSLSKRYIFDKHARKKVRRSGIYGHIGLALLAIPIISDIVIICYFGYTFISLIYTII